MSNPEPSSTREVWRRRALIAGWVGVGLMYLLEFAWFAWRDHQVDRLNNDRVAITATERKSARGTMLICWAERDARPLFAVLEGPFAESPGHFLGGERIWQAPGKGPGIWLQVTRTESVPAVRQPPHLFYFHDGKFEAMPFGADFSSQDLQRFMNTPEVFDGIAGFKRWIAHPQRPATGPKMPTTISSPNVR